MVSENWPARVGKTASMISHLPGRRAAAFNESLTRPSIPPIYEPYIPVVEVSYKIDQSLCKWCQDIVTIAFDGWDKGIILSEPGVDSDKRYLSVEDHHDSTVRALSSSAVTCRLCKLIEHDLKQFHGGQTREAVTEESRYALLMDPTPNGSIYVGLRDQFDGLGDRIPICLYRQRTRSPNDICGGFECGKFIWQLSSDDGVLMVPVPNTYPSTKEAVGQVQEWLTRCGQAPEHAVCARTRLSIGLPKRVLDLTISRDTISLYESQGEIEPYAALSYSWGPGVPLRTTTRNLAQHKEGISISALPETLKDAVLFARDLGFRFLWIDALCIVQDDSSDWVDQAAAMTSIYHGCALNIAILDAPSCDAGAVRKFRDYSVRVGTSNNSGTSGESVDTYIFGGIAYKHSLFEAQRQNLLSTRGWVFQETLVSVASVYVTHNGLSWECCSETCFENQAPDTCIAQGHPNINLTDKASWADHNGETPHYIDYYRGSRQERLSDEKKLLRPFRSFYGWISKLSQRHLTYASDKLPSIAGLATRVASTSNATYVAGIWKEDLLVGLSWSAASPGSLTRVKNRAPSWSWASVDGTIHYLWCILTSSLYPASVCRNEKLDLKILSVSVNEKFPGRCGEVVDGRIDAEGWMQAGAIRLDPEQHVFHFDFDVHDECDFEYMLDDCDEFDALAGVPVPCWLLRLTSVVAEGASEKRRGPYIFFLVLIENDVGASKFRRVGFAQVDGSTPRRRSLARKYPNASTNYFNMGERKRLSLV